MPNHSKTAVYTGSFDPLHLGHENIVRRASRLFDKVVVGIGVNPEKHSLFTPEERVTMVEDVLDDLKNVEVVCFQGLAVHFVRDLGATVLLRGIRALADLDYEFTMSLTNSTLDPEIETFFLMAQKEYMHLSSTLIRQIAVYGGDLTPFVPSRIKDRLRERLSKPRPNAKK
jgi:pantetheine-phosphate adenylyltransferase